MNESLSLETTLKQQQRLTPLQVQFVKLLEMTTPEIEDTVRRAIDEMPALEAKDSDNDDDPLTAATLDNNDPDPTPYYNRRSRNYSPDDQYFDATASAPDRAPTLIESLSEQLALLDLTDIDNTIATNIIGNLDDNGYITRDLTAIADDITSATSQPVSTSQVYDVWQKVRTLDPAGIGAVDLRDCLLLQLHRLSPSPGTKTATEIIKHYFDIFSKMHFDKLKSVMNIDDDELKEALTVIKRLNPKPGGALSSGRSDDDAPAHITPDFAIEIDGDRLILSMPHHIPELSIERTFAEDTPITEATPRSNSESAAIFIKRKRDEAQAFIKVLSMRHETLYRVMQAILKIQRDFFMTGDEKLIRPMILRDLKNMTGYDISVISRATAGKYVTTPHGTYALKSLFNEHFKDNIGTSSHKIFASIRELIEHEDPNHPLSDQHITDQINSTGNYNIARRTVAKYRERLGYPVARLRRKI